MKKTLWILAIVAIVALTVGITGYAYAQGGQPPLNSDSPYGPGSGRGRGGMMGGYNGEYGPMHESMVTAFSDVTGLSVEEIESRHDAGETMWDIAADAGLSEDEVYELMLAARETALEDAVENGWVTEEHAEWMLERMSQMGNGDYGYGGCGGRGRGRGFNNPGWQSNQN